MNCRDVVDHQLQELFLTDLFQAWVSSQLHQKIFSTRQCYWFVSPLLAGYSTNKQETMLILQHFFGEGSPPRICEYQEGVKTQEIQTHDGTKYDPVQLPVDYELKTFTLPQHTHLGPIALYPVDKGDGEIEHIVAAATSDETHKIKQLLQNENRGDPAKYWDLPPVLAAGQCHKQKFLKKTKTQKMQGTTTNISKSS